jgi:hypothetical protein
VSESIIVSATGALPKLFNVYNSDHLGLQVDAAELNAYRALPALLSLLPFSSTAGAHGPIPVHAQAMDVAGNVGNASIQVYIRHTYPSQDQVCTGGTVAVSGVCEPNVLNSSSSSSNITLPNIPQDSSKPWIEVFGSGPRHTAILSPNTGLRVVETYVNVGSTYQDAGAAAVDDTDGDLTSMISAYGLKTVNVFEPTPPLQPHVIRYNVIDSEGNAAVTKTRRVFVLCPVLETLCQSRNDPGFWYCDTSSDCTLAPSRRFTRPLSPQPEIQLLGSTRVQVLQGSTYHRCMQSTPLGHQCDLGVKAWDAIEGDLIQFVHACKEGHTFWDYGLQACNLDTETAGEYTLRFWIRDSATNESSSVVRTVHVLERCEGDESRCSNGSCSIGTFCESGHSPLDDSILMLPILHLLGIPGQSSASAVSIPYGQAYKACDPSSISLPSSPCEAGLFFSMH